MMVVMSRRKAAGAALLAATLATACYGSEGSGEAQGRASASSTEPAPGQSASLEPAQRCRHAVRVRDRAHDTRSWVIPEPAGRPPTPPSADLRQFELRA